MVAADEVEGAIKNTINAAVGRLITLASNPIRFAGQEVGDALPSRVVEFVASDYPDAKHNLSTCAILNVNSA